jgi:hypothetical protein
MSAQVSISSTNGSAAAQTINSLTIQTRRDPIHRAEGIEPFPTSLEKVFGEIDSIEAASSLLTARG